MIVIHYIYIAWDETVDGLTLCYRGAVRVQSTGRAGDTGHGEQGQYSTVQYSTVQAGLVTLDTVSRDNGTMGPADTADQRSSGLCKY